VVRFGMKICPAKLNSPSQAASWKWGVQSDRQFFQLWKQAEKLNIPNWLLQVAI